MKWLKRYAGVVTCLLLCVHNGQSLAATLTLHDPAMIRDAERVGQAIHHLSDKVMRCVAQNGGRPDECVCRNPCACRFKQDYAAVRAAFNRAIRRHPGWAGNIVYYQTSQHPKGFSISFSKALQRHFRKSCQPRH